MKFENMDECKVAYLILAHTDAIHLEKLVKAIDYKARIFIHLDAKSRMSDFVGLKLPKSAEFIKERVKVYWGGFSMVKATLNLMKAALTSGEKFSHLVLLSGLDYPIKPSWAIYNFLTNHSNKQFIRFIDMQESPTPQMKRIFHYWFMEPIFPFSFYIDKSIRSILQKLLGLGVFKKPLKNMAPTFGSQWWAITPECASYILQFVVDNPQFVDFYKYSHAPDEHFFHTIVANSSYLNQTDGFQKGIKWPRQMANLHIIYLNKIFNESNFDEIKVSDKYFIRKVMSKKSSRLIELIDKNCLLNP